MRTMHYLLTLLILLAVAVMPASAQARKSYTFGLINEFGEDVTDAVTYVIYDGSDDSDITSSCYTGMTGTTAVDVTTSTGQLQFFTKVAYVDVKVTHDANLNATRTYDLYPYHHKLMLSRHVGVLGATTYTGALVGVGSTWTGDMTLGATGAGVDTKWWATDAGNYLLFDEDLSALLTEDTNINVTDDDKLLFGTGASNDGDLSLSSNSSNLLTFGQVASGTGTVAVGVDGTGIDWKFFGDTASDYMEWDQDGSTNGALVFEDSIIHMMDDTTLVFGDGSDITMQYDEDGDNDLQITGNVSFEGDVLITDSDSLLIGTGSDMTIVSDGTNTTIAGSGTITIENSSLTIGNAITDGLTITAAIQGASAFILDGSTDDTNETIISVTDPTGDNTLTIPDDSGQFVYTPTGVVDYAAGAGGLPTTHALITYASSGGAEALTLANGENGQILVITHDTDGGNGVLTPATKTGWTSVDLADDGDTISLMYIDDSVGWVVLGTSGTAAPPALTVP